MKTTFRDLWPGAFSLLGTYLVCAVVLGVLAAGLESAGLGTGTLLLLVVVAILPAHYCIYRIRVRVALRGEEGKLARAAAAGVGSSPVGDEQKDAKQQLPSKRGAGAGS